MTSSELSESFWSFVKHNKYPIYILFVFMLVYIINQCDTFCLIATNPSMAQDIEYGDRECDVRAENISDVEEYLMSINESDFTPSQFCLNNTEKLCSDNVDPSQDWCYWHYPGTGIEYQILAGPMYVVLFAVSGIPLGLASEISNTRKLFLVVCVVMWSIMTALGGFATEYWHLAITRLVMGIFSAGCVPFCTSMIADYFKAERRGTALGLFYWGVFIGYSLSFVLIIAEEELGWRAVYFIAGIPGIAIGLLVAVTVKEPPRRPGSGLGEDEKALSKFSNMLGKIKIAATYFSDPVLMMLCLAGAIRNGAGLVWAYNIVIFFEEYHADDTNVEQWMSWIPLTFGSAGAFGGGYISDRLAANRGVKGRLLILIGCCLITAPFQIGTLFLPYPFCWVSHMAAYLLGEAWLGVCAAIVIELVPADLSASAMAVYLFCIKIIGGNMTLFVPPLTKALDLRWALVITFPGLYVIGGLLFIVTLLLYIRKEKNEYQLDGSGKSAKRKSKDMLELNIDDDDRIAVNSTEVLTEKSSST